MLGLLFIATLFPPIIVEKSFIDPYGFLFALPYRSKINFGCLFLEYLVIIIPSVALFIIFKD